MIEIVLYDESVKVAATLRTVLHVRGEVVAAMRAAATTASVPGGDERSCDG